MNEQEIVFRSTRTASSLALIAADYNVTLRQNPYTVKPPKKYIVYAYGEKHNIEKFLEKIGERACV